MARCGRVFTVTLLLLVALPFVALAQQSAGGIAGVVRDSQGAVMPGVTVEVSSPALIERVRSVTTDREGEYKIIDLRPGVYMVTFTITGFTSARREGIELTTGFTAAVNVEMQVGAIEETLIVAGTAPVVDVHNVVQQAVITHDIMENLP